MSACNTFMHLMYVSVKVWLQITALHTCCLVVALQTLVQWALTHLQPAGALGSVSHGASKVCACQGMLVSLLLSRASGCCSGGLVNALRWVTQCCYGGLGNAILKG